MIRVVFHKLFAGRRLLVDCFGDTQGNNEAFQSAIQAD